MSYITHTFKLYGLQSRLTLQCFPCACWLVVGPGWGKNGDYWMVGYCLYHYRGSQQRSWLQMTGWIDNSPTWWFVPWVFLKKIIESPYDYLLGSCHLMSLCMSPIWMRNSTAHAKKLNMCVLAKSTNDRAVEFTQSTPVFSQDARRFPPAADVWNVLWSAMPRSLRHHVKTGQWSRMTWEFVGI